MSLSQDERDTLAQILLSLQENMQSNFTTMTFVFDQLGAQDYWETALKEFAARAYKTECLILQLQGKTEEELHTYWEEKEIAAKKRLSELRQEFALLQIKPSTTGN